MNAESLLASAGINIGLAIVMLSLFSVLKKQPFLAAIYFARRIANGEELPIDRGFSLRRLCPSVFWIPRVFRLSEDDFLRQHGLDALVLLRLFKLGINFFSVFSVLGLLILVPVNYASQQDSTSSVISYSMDLFTISNVQKGSNRLWVHFTCLCFVTLYALSVLYKEYKALLNKRIECIGSQKYRPDYFTILVRGIPLCEEHKVHGCSVDHFFSKHYPCTYQSYEMIYSREKQLKNYWMLGFIEVLLQGFPAAFVSFKSRTGATIAAETRQHPHPLLWVTESAPEPSEVIWRNITIPQHNLPIRNITAFVAVSILTIFFALPVTAIQGIVQFEKLQKWFPPARAVQLIPGLTSILTGYLPSAILKIFIYVIPYAILVLASLEGSISKSKQEIRTCTMVFYFLVGNVFFLSLLSGSLLDQIGESFTHPKYFPTHLASAVSAQSGFFVSYILTDGLSGFSLELIQLGLILWHFIKSPFDGGTAKDPYLYGFPYYRVIPTVSLALLIGMVYAVIAPLLLPFLIIYFFLGYAVYVNQIQDVYKIIYDTHGQYWPYIHHFIIITIVLMQITMIGLFGLKSKPAASISTVILVLLTILFNEYCKLRFLPSFLHLPIQIAKEMDDAEEVEGENDATSTSVSAKYAYRRQPTSFEPSSSTQPLLSA